MSDALTMINESHRQSFCDGLLNVGCPLFQIRLIQRPLSSLWWVCCWWRADILSTLFFDLLTHWLDRLRQLISQFSVLAFTVDPRGGLVQLVQKILTRNMSMEVRT